MMGALSPQPCAPEPYGTISRLTSIAEERDRVATSMKTHSRVRTWLEIREPLERQLEPLGRAAMEAIGLSEGHRVLDVGCGVGGTPLALSRRVGPRGQVIGLDVLPDAIDVLRGDDGNPENVSFICGDAQTYGFAAGSFDAVFSRFGVMFFDDATEAFRNLLKALRPGGRLGFVCWRNLSDNELDELPLRAASPHLPPGLVNSTAASAWFSFSKAETIRQVLDGAGFSDVEITSRDEWIGSGSLQDMVAVCSRVGALGAILRDHPHLTLKAVLALEDALRERDGPNGPELRAGVWIVTAKAP